MTRCVGLDAHRKHCVYLIEDETGTVAGEGLMPTTFEGPMLPKRRPAGMPGVAPANR
jgi:hypothetical protein